MANSKTDFLKFSAYSIKDLITRKLSEDSRFTDQVYEGSNLAILIDIVSYMYQCLMYNLNNAAAESMFSDTQIYENINRLCKFIGYHPGSCGAMTAEFRLDGNITDGTYIPKYSCIDTGLTDTNGRKVYYSTIQDEQINTNETYTLLMYNGKWKMYSTVFTSNGDKYQKFILDGIQSNSASNKFVPSDCIHVYVLEKETDQRAEPYDIVQSGLFTDNNINNGTLIYNSNVKIVDLRLNENKTYEITFGNGYNGYIPPKDSLIYVMYLDGNGPSGKIDAGQIEGKPLRSNPSLYGISQELYDKIIMSQNGIVGSIADQEIVPDSVNKWTNITNSTDFVSEESVEDIRTNAPEWFKTGNRLVTNADYEYYFRNKNISQVVDVVCQNNWEYISTLYKWLYNLSLNGNYTRIDDLHFDQSLQRSQSTTYYINQNRLIKYDLKWADAADINNVYLWIKMRNNSDLMRQKFDSDVKTIKTLTQELVYLKPLDLYFAPCAAPIDLAINYFKPGNSAEFDPNNESYIEVTLDDNCIYTNIDMQTRIANVIRQFFSENNMKLGVIVNFNELLQQIYNLGSIVRVRTIYKNADGALNIQPGLCFATWTTELIDLGDDLTISNSSRSLEAFQFPKLYQDVKLKSKIQVIRKTTNNINVIQY